MLRLIAFVSIQPGFASQIAPKQSNLSKRFRQTAVYTYLGSTKLPTARLPFHEIVEKVKL